MYKAWVVDDEPIIVKGITKMIPWEKYGCEAAGTASDGKEALALAEKIRPDIIFTDIYMPGMDGLLLIAALRVSHEDMEISILTGYRDFELAQKALNLGVTRFLLKPSSLTELEEALAVMTARLKKKGILPEGKGQREEGNAGSGTGKSTGSDAGKSTGSDTGESTGSGIGKYTGSGTGKNTGSGVGISAGTEAEMAADPAVKNTDAIFDDVSSGDGHPVTGIRNTPAANFLVNAALAYLEKNFCRKITLNEVAEHVYVSQWHLSKLINQYIGRSFTELLNAMRIDRAGKLLEDPAYRIADIAELTGFQDVAHFSRVFKKKEGMPPNEYRNRLRIERK